MKRVVRLLRQPEFHLFLLCLLFMLINWPFLFIPAGRGLMSIFSYLFLLWALFIVILFIIQHSLREDGGSNDEGGA